MREKIEDQGDQEKLISSVSNMEKSYGRDDFVTKYKEFMAVAANHMAIIAPFIPALTNLLSS